MKAAVGLVFILTSLAGSRSDEGYFWHITDFHYDITYESEKRSCYGDGPTPGVYGDYRCDSPWRLVEDSISSMATIKRKVDFILWTGDSVAHIKDEYLNVIENLAMIEKVTDLFKREFPEVKVYATMGNRDWYPAHQFPSHSDILYNATAQLWKEWIGNDQQLDNFRKGAFYTVTLQPGLRIVGLNTAFYYRKDKVTAEIPDPGGQLVWLEEVLQDARKAGEKVIVTGHVPPGIKVPGRVMWFYQTFNTRFLDMVQTFTDVISGMYFGHNHVDQLKLLHTPEGRPGVPIFVAPSVTPWGHHNPAGRLLKYDRTTGLALDYTQYYMNLTASNLVEESSWKIEYTARDAYNVADLSADSVQDMIQKMTDDERFLDKYIRFNYVLANERVTIERCDVMCRAEYICGFTKHETQQFQNCVIDFVTNAT